LPHSGRSRVTLFRGPPALARDLRGPDRHRWTGSALAERHWASPCRSFLAWRSARCERRRRSALRERTSQRCPLPIPPWRERRAARLGAALGPRRGVLPQVWWILATETEHDRCT